MSIGENWLAPQPTANIANAILTQAPDPPRATVVLAMTSTLTCKLSNLRLTMRRLLCGHGPRRRPGRGGQSDRRPSSCPDTPRLAGRHAAIRFGPGRGGWHLPVAGQRAPQEAGRGRAGPRPAPWTPAALLDRLGTGGRRAGDPYPDRARQQGRVADRRDPGAEPALGAHVLRPSGRRSRRLGHRSPGHTGAVRGGGRHVPDGGGWRGGVWAVRHRRGPARAPDPAAAAAVHGLERAPLPPRWQPGRRPDQEPDRAPLDHDQ